MTHSQMKQEGEGFELSDELLERIAGGKLTEQDIDDYCQIMVAYKKKGWTKEAFVAGYDFLGAEQQREIADLVEKYW